ncbi:DUF29 domain-containing protein [Crenothrix polyspora]|jgi:Domain of unknown function DUF29|uniref:DUF29 domain-containing protein n=1 Tax=Crenothrix polyspora TaxID=360316 RepID=A0A1R4HDL6_9GAMM|nr:DUF29 domain-containing protein [Crenothrix polyspora]SJM94313.1 conserved hypothetical protein [Crenothrix polyspora]
MIDYQTDYYGWTVEQAELLKARDWQEIDIENLIEEVESMGRSEKRALESRLIVLITHLLKWQYQPVRRSTSWELTIKEQRLRISKILRDNPSLKRELDVCFLDIYPFAVIQAVKETGIEEKNFPIMCEWTLEHVLSVRPSET